MTEVEHRTRHEQRDYETARHLYYRAHFGESGMIEEIAAALAQVRREAHMRGFRVGQEAAAADG